MILLSSALVAVHVEECVKALLMKAFMMLRVYFSGHSLALLRQKPRLVVFTYTSVEVHHNVKEGFFCLLFCV